MRTRSPKGLLSPLGVALVAMLALGALFGSASASAATQHWYGDAGGTKLAEETPTEVAAEDEVGATIELGFAGIEIEIGCKSMSAGGEVTNPSGGASGTLTGAGLTFGECAVAKPAACTVPSTIKTIELKGEATKFEGSPAIKYSPQSGTTITTFMIDGGSCPSAIKGVKEITGSFMAPYGGSGGHYWVGKLSSEGLKFGGSSGVTLLTNYQLNSKSGKAVALVADSPAGVGHWYLGGAPSEGPKTKLPEGSALSYSSLEGSMSSTISATIGGVAFKMQCGGSSSGAEGTVENPAGGGAGTATGTIAFGGCVVSEPTGGKCSVNGGGATSLPLSGLATEAGGAPAASFSPAEKTTIVTFGISGASCPTALKGTKSLTGSLTGVPDPFGTYAFSGNEGLKFSGQIATVSIQATLETTTGERLGLAP